MSLIAADNGNLNEVQRLVSSGVNVNAKDNDGKTALIEASESGFTIIVKYLIENGANVNEKDRDGDSALIEGDLIKSV